MPRRLVISAALIVMFLSLLLTDRARPDVDAQEGDPAPTPRTRVSVLSEGLTLNQYAVGQSEVVPAAPATFVLGRLTLDAGVSYIGFPGDGSLRLAFAQAGSVTVTIADEVTVFRAASLDGEAEPNEEIPADTEFILNPGDSFVWLPFVEGELRNDGDASAVLLMSYLAPRTS